MLLDPTLPEKQRARRRLVGAIALVVAAVVILPMVLDSHPKPVTDDISIDIPSRPVSRARVQNPEDTQAGVAPDNPAAPENATGASNLVPAAPPTAAAAQAPGRSGTAPQAAGAQQADTAAAQRSTSGTSGKTQQQAATASANNAATSTMSATPATKPPVKNSSAANTAANTPQNPSAAASSRSSTTSSPSAQSTAAAAQTEPATPAAVPPGSRFAVQLGSFPDDSSARAWESKLKAAGVPAYTEKRKQTDGSVRTLLRAGPFADRSAASAAIAKVREAGLTSGANNGSAQ
ncbi:SPOR domain-containing protein [Paraburkholderia jirisanensis]